jgi:DNA-binding TFAR19-related protein (PDSD5 family)
LREQMLSRILGSEAQERLSNLQAVDPKRVRQIGDHIVNMARSGQILQEVRAPRPYTHTLCRR